MHCYSFVVPGPSVIKGEHFESPYKKDRRFDVVADGVEQRHEFIKRFIGIRTEDDLLTSFAGRIDEGAGDVVAMLKAAQRFLGSVKIVGFIQSYNVLLPGGWTFNDEWLIAREGDKERVFYSQGFTPKNEYEDRFSNVPAGFELAQRILDRF